MRETMSNYRMTNPNKKTKFRMTTKAKRRRKPTIVIGASPEFASILATALAKQERKEKE
jgi:hypothetical protein